MTIWSDHTRDFDDSALKTLKSPIMMAFARFRVTEYRGFNNLHCLKTPPFLYMVLFLGIFSNFTF